MINAADIVRMLVKREGAKFKDIATQIGVTSSNFSEKLKANTIKGQELLDIIAYLGYEVVFTKNGDIYKAEPLRKGVGERCKQVVEGIEYDTDRSDAICHISNAEMLIELYRDGVGRFFTVLYPKWDAGAKIVSISDEEALDIYNRYGDGSCSYIFENSEKYLKNALTM